MEAGLQSSACLPRRGALLSVNAAVHAERPAESRDVLTDDLAGDAPPEPRPHNAYVLGLQRDRKAAPVLVEATGDPREAVESSARRALEQMSEGRMALQSVDP